MQYCLGSTYPNVAVNISFDDEEIDKERGVIVEEWRLRRAGNLAMFDGITMQVQCGGLSFIRVGLVVTLNVASPETTSQGKRDVAFDKFLSGTYLITAIRHIFANDKGEIGYKMIVELTKDGLDEIATGRIPRKLGNE